MKTPLTRLALFAAAGTTMAAGAAAQVTISGPLSDATTGPLTAGVYEAQFISVLPGETLTIDPGVVIKFDFDGAFTVEGTLLVQGTAADPVIFTDPRDDAAGGDTNGDGGATVPVAGWWRGIEFLGTASASVMENAVVRYGGRFIAGIELVDCDASFSGVTVTDISSTGFDLNLNSFPVLSDCGVERAFSRAFDGVALEAVPGFSGLTASGSGAGDRVWINEGALPAGTSVQIGPQNGINGVLFSNDPFEVPVGSTLTMDAGLVLKMRFDSGVFVEGILEVNGTAAQPVVITEERDDTVGGDTNGDGGISVPLPGWWRGIDLNETADASSLSHLDLRYGGRFISALEMTECDATIEGLTVSDFSTIGVDLNGTSQPVINGADITNCVGTAIADAPLTALAGFTNLTASGNTNDWIDVTEGTVPSGTNLVLGPENGLFGTLRLNSLLLIESGASLTLSAGMVVLHGFDSQVICDGPLHCEGTQVAPVWFVDERDDLAGNGDTGGGAVPNPGWWRGLLFRGGSTGSELSWTNVLHGGRFQANVLVEEAGISMEHCRIAEGSGPGMDFAASSQPCTIRACTVTNCMGDAITGVRVDRLPDFRRNGASGTALNTIEITEGSVGADLEIAPANMVNGNVVLTADLEIAAGARLTLLPDVALRMTFDRGVTVAGSLDVASTFERPAIITSSNDETVTDDEGLAPGSAGFWRGVAFEPSSGPSNVRGLTVRNGGRFIANVQVNGGDVSLDEVRSETCSTPAFRFVAAPARAERLAAWRSAGGFDIVATDAVDYRQLTAAGCTLYGVRGPAGFLGTVTDSISRDLAANNFMLPPGALRFSNGSPSGAGSDGNINADPLFVDAVNGDLNLAAGSPSIDAGAPSSPLDPNGTRADQGAYSVNDLKPEVFCTQVDNADCEPRIETVGFASMSGTDPFVVSLENAPTQSIGLYFYGTGARAQIAGVFGNLCVSNPYARTPVIMAGGDEGFGGCDGRFEFDGRAYVQSGADPNLGPGVTMVGAFWYRDPSAPGAAKFSEAVDIPIGN